MREEFIAAFSSRQAEFGVSLADGTIERLAAYFELVQKHNPLLHLVAPCSPEEFAVRHVLESLALLEFLPHGSRFADVGTGAGLPAIPCLIARDDISGVLIESKQKKALYLNTAAQQLRIGDRVEVVNRQFAEVSEKRFTIVTCRALDRFAERLPRLLNWAGPRTLLLFGGESIGHALNAAKVGFEGRLMPRSEQRFLFIVDRRTEAC